jgi:hypothetical protein
MQLSNFRGDMEAQLQKSNALSNISSAIHPISSANHPKRCIRGLRRARDHVGSVNSKLLAENATPMLSSPCPRCIAMSTLELARLDASMHGVAAAGWSATRDTGIPG